MRRFGVANPASSVASRMRRCVMTMMTVTGALISFVNAAPRPMAADAVQDVFVPETLQHNQTCTGYLGNRMSVNIERRLLSVNQDEFLSAFKNPSDCSGYWSGEYPGKLLHACVEAWRYTGDPRLMTRMASMAATFKADQGSDGYLGTYAPSCRWVGWDVWIHKYDLIGLLAYYQATGDTATLRVCTKIGDMLCATFGSGRLDILKSGQHTGMAATSVLEPMVALYRFTGNASYLSFCTYLVSSWAQSGGPNILNNLLANQDITAVDDKAYEKLSNLIGLADLYRMSGTTDYLTACKNAWNNIYLHHHLIMGSSTGGESFTHADQNPPSTTVEPCVTVTWMQFTWQMLRLTGEAKYADELERCVYNALTAEQSPVSGAVTGEFPEGGLNGVKPYNGGASCCMYSLQRGIAMIPSMALGTLNGDAMVLLYLPGTHDLTVKGAGGAAVAARLSIASSLPEIGSAAIAVTPAATASFGLQLYVPSWCTGLTATVGGQTYTGAAGAFLAINRQWSSGTRSGSPCR